MSFAATTGRMALRATRQQLHKAPQRRSMAGGGGPAPEWEGVDKVVRGVFPGDHQLAMAIMGGYLGIYTLYSIKSAMTKKPAKPAITPTATDSATPSSGMPPMDSPEFEKYLDTPAFLKEIDSDEFWATVGGK